ncbi:MAG: hypothetical protein KDA98_10035 [Acidimicrobiales bacterium]|nr:hypothetical protein [Acidimicrobiales bacterium]
MRRSLLRAAPPAAAAAVLALLDRPVGALVVAVVAVVLVLLGIAAPRAAVRLDAAVARVAGTAATSVSYALASLAWLLGVVPAWAWSRLWRRSPTANAWVDERSAWTIPPSASHRSTDGAPQGAQRSGAPDALRRPPSLGRRLAHATIAIALMLAAMAVVAERRGIAWPFGDRGGEAAAPPPVTGGSAPAATDPPEAPPSPGDAGTDLDIPEVSSTPVTTDVTIETVPPRRSDGREVDEFDGMPVDDYAHDGEPWAPLHFGDLSQLPYAADLFLASRFADYQSETVNIVGGHRVSYTPDDPELTVWFFGGSTMFGLGQRDEHTLPSVVARAAEADGIRIRPVNFGVMGYVNWQETEQFQQAITSGPDRPDLVVFYDGVNDYGMGSFRVDMGEREPGNITRLTINDEEREQLYRERGSPEPMPWSQQRRQLQIDLSADQYRRGVDISRRLGAQFDVPVLHVWQPSPFAKDAKPADEPLWDRVDFNPDWMDDSAEQYRAIPETAGVDPIDLTRSLDDVDEAVYFDSSHTNELGASIVGTALYEALRPALDEAAAQR